jgi:secondary thiamine-phosphate synthase enzyme
VHFVPVEAILETCEPLCLSSREYRFREVRDMEIKNYILAFPTTGKTDLVDITREVAVRVRDSDIVEGSVLIFVPGSTAALTTIEYESGVIEDLKEAIAMLAPESQHYRHDASWGDGNGYSHVRAALLGPSLTIPVIEGKLVLGTWQQVILCDFDNRPRKRQIILQVSGKVTGDR